MTAVLARALSLYVDVLGWAFDRFADVAEPAGRHLVRAAEDARWYATATRCVP